MDKRVLRRVADGRAQYVMFGDKKNGRSDRGHQLTDEKLKNICAQ